MLRRAFYPLLVASQTVPIVVIAPILVVWLGFGIGPKLVIIALVCFFPITVNTLDGLRSVDPDLLKMMRTLDASRWQTLRRVEAPSALPYFFSGAKIAVAVAVIGAVFGEWAGSSSGLGHLIQQASGQLQTARMFAAVVVLSALAIVLFGAARADRAAGRLVGPRDEDPMIDKQEAIDQRRSKSVRAIAVALVVCAAVLAAGCGEKSEPTSAGKPQPLQPRARLLRQPRPRRHLRGARQRATSSDAGLDVQPQTPSNPSAPIQEVASGRADLAISYEPEVLLAHDQGLPVKAVAAAGAHSADLADLAQGLRHQGRRGPPRQDDRHRRASPISRPT